MRRVILPLLLLVPGAVLAQRPPQLPDFDRRTPAVLAVENVGPAVVNIKTQALAYRTPHLFEGLFWRSDPGDRKLRDRSLGSGFVVHPDGYVLTNEHVVHGADRILVTLRDGRRVLAEVVNANADNDLAVLRLEEPGPYPYAVLGDSDDLLVGETTMALGNPFGLSNSVTRGILSAVDRSIPFRGRRVYKDFLQTSALINPGNSGGPLLDVNGRVIGINVAIDTRGQGISYAIPINRAKEVMTRLVDPTIIKQAWLGIDIEEAEDGLAVARVHDQGPGNRAGVRPGDRVLAVEDRRVSNAFDFNVAVLRHRTGEAVDLTLGRGSRTLEVSVPFVTMPVTAQAPERYEGHGMVCADLTPPLARRFGYRESTRAIVVLRVEPGSMADKVGLQPGDIILELGGVRVRDVDYLARVINAIERQASSTATRLVIYRQGYKLDGKIVL